MRRRTTRGGCGFSGVRELVPRSEKSAHSRRARGCESLSSPPMSVAIVTGSGGLIGSESVRHLIGAGFDVVGIENDMRSYFFGPESSTSPVTEELKAAFPAEFRSVELDIRDAEGVSRL